MRKDIEQTFAVIVQKFDILSRSIRFQRKDVIRNVLHTSIVLHNMTVIQRRKDYVSERVYYHDRNNTSNSGPPWMMDKCGPPRSRPIEVLIAHKLIL